MWAVIYYYTVVWAPTSELWLPGTAVNAGSIQQLKMKSVESQAALKARMTSPASKACSARSS